MKTSILSAVLFSTLCFFASACSGDSKEASSRDTTEVEGTITNKDGEEVSINSSEDISNAISDALRELNNGQEVEAVDFRELKDLLPERLSGMERTSLQGEKTGMAGLKYSVAKAQYEQGDTEMDISIVDGAGFAGIVTGFAAWSMVEVDRETDTGYERTTEINGHKAFEKYDSQSKDGQLSVIIQERFIINIEADDLDNDRLLREVFKDLNLRKLERLQ